MTCRIAGKVRINQASRFPASALVLVEILNADSKVGRDGEDALRGLRANI